MENIKKEETGATLTMKGNWQNQSKELQKKFSALTDSDLKYTKEGEVELVNRISTRLGKTREEVISIITKGQN